MCTCRCSILNILIHVYSTYVCYIRLYMCFTHWKYMYLYIYITCFIYHVHVCIPVYTYLWSTFVYFDFNRKICLFQIYMYVCTCIYNLWSVYLNRKGCLFIIHAYTCIYIYGVFATLNFIRKEWPFHWLISSHVHVC